MFTRERGEEGVRRERNGWGGGEGSQAEEAHVSLPACQARYEWAVTWIQADSEHWLCWIRIQTESLHMSLQLLFVQHFVFYNVNQISLGFTPVRRKRRLMVTNYKLETFPSFHSHLVWLPVKTKVLFRHLCVFPWVHFIIKGVRGAFKSTLMYQPWLSRFPSHFRYSISQLNSGISSLKLR